MIAEANEKASRLMPTTGRIYGAILAAKRQVGAVGKNGSVKEYGSYDYRKFDDVLNAVAPLLNEHGILVVSEVIHKEERQDGKKHFVTITMGYKLFAEDGSFVEGSQVGEAFDVGDKAATKAQTVALRIFYCTTFNIPFDEMKDPEAGPQHGWDNASRSTFNRLVSTLDSLQDAKAIDKMVRYAIKCTGATQENGDRLSKEDLSKSIEVFSASARRLRFPESTVAEIISILKAAVNGGPVPVEKPIEAVEPVRYRELKYLFDAADDDVKRERCVLTLLQSYRTGAIEPEELNEIVTHHCPEDDTNGGACFLLGIIHNAGTAAEVAGLSSSVQMAIQQKQVGRDAGAALSQYAQHRINKLGEHNDDD